MKADYWLGLKNISCLTGAKLAAQLRVDLADFEGHHKYAQYSYFSVGNPSTNYTLSVGDSLHAVHNGMQFTTDKDNDRNDGIGDCAVQWQGAWWYNTCHVSLLNGLYLSGANDNRGMRWYTFNTATGSYSLKWTEMKLR